LLFALALLAVCAGGGLDGDGAVVIGWRVAINCSGFHNTRLGQMTDARAMERLKVFISYSRRDSIDFADELLAGLELAGFAPFLDRHDIVPGEPWEERLGGLIQQADTVVFIVSPEAVKSERCTWEVDRALAESKRLLPVIFKAVPETEMPRELHRRQFVRFDAGLGITHPLAQLAEALRKDIDWTREHTRLGELAGRWAARGRPESLLLRGDELAAAQAWGDRWKPGEPEVTERIQAFIAASKQAEEADLAKMQAARRRVRWAQAFALLCLLSAGGALFGWWQQNWLNERVYMFLHVNALSAAQEKALKPNPNDGFQECTDCPQMVVVPSGKYMMGSPATESGRLPREGPQHSVTIATQFAVSKFELTFAQWDACSAHGGCSPDTSDNGWGRGQQPVINVSWNDAQRYVSWLAKITGKNYRLLTEAEYEYAARAGTQTAYPWGDAVTLNGTTMADCSGCGSKWDGKQPAPVGSFPPNQFGLYDMVGNVAEWVEDCYHGTYDGAPADGSAWLVGVDCSIRVQRGGGYQLVFKQIKNGGTDAPPVVRSAYRAFSNVDGGNLTTGFRVARTLSP
jgi:formylglycine-generating enzyme required for sulfatase activity